MLRRRRIIRPARKTVQPNDLERMTREYLEKAFRSVHALRVKRIRERSWNGNWVYHVQGTATVAGGTIPNPEAITFALDLMIDRQGNMLNCGGRLFGERGKAIPRNIR